MNFIVTADEHQVPFAKRSAVESSHMLESLQCT